MLKPLIRRRVRSIFDALSRGDSRLALAGLSNDVHHIFAGDHALGGERHSRHAFERWFERLFRLFELRFDVRRVIVSGPPWNIYVAVEWVANGKTAAGEPYGNEGAHVLRILWGKVVYVHAYEDSQRVAQACRRMADAGIEEAAAAPITD
jgi:ketosteroid isomerase-like protein